MIMVCKPSEVNTGPWFVCVQICGAQCHVDYVVKIIAVRILNVLMPRMATMRQQNLGQHNGLVDLHDK